MLSLVRYEGFEHPVAFGSRLLTPLAEKLPLASVEGDCLALVWATETYRHYLHGRELKVFTEQENLMWLQTTQFSNRKVERWALRLQELRLQLQPLPGKDNGVADYVLRACATQLHDPEESLLLLAARLEAVPAGSAWPQDPCQAE
jgi:hypothetical protein